MFFSYTLISKDCNTNMKIICTQCTRTFKTVKAMKQHCSAVHTYCCAPCNRSFKTIGALLQHDNAVHPDESVMSSDSESEYESDDLFAEYEPPFADADGEWVDPQQCNQRKSFGWFECVCCNKTWMSAHAQARYAQGCKMCNVETLPVCMWQNSFKYKETDQPTTVATIKPHDRSRCEACRAGMCLKLVN